MTRPRDPLGNPGVELIDTADAYGPAFAEQLISAALWPYEGVTVATKGGMTRPGPHDWVPNGRPEHLRRSCVASLRRLRIDAISLYQLHMPDPVVPFEESVGALAELQREGKVVDVGLSNVTAVQLEKALGIVPIASVQNGYNLLNRESRDVVDACEQRRVPFLAWFPLSSGSLATTRRLEQVASAKGATPAQVALAWLLHESPMIIPIPGTTSIDHLEQNLDSERLTLSEAEVTHISGRRAPARRGLARAV